MNVLFTAALFSGTAAIGLWLTLRVPRLASAPVLAALVAAAVSVQALRFAPVWTSSTPALYMSVFFVLAPLLVMLWLSVIALLGAVRPR